jgi:hypothetical protein
MDADRLSSSLAADTIVAVAVGRLEQPPHNTHTGLVFKDSNGRLAALHLGWHEILLFDTYALGYVFSCPAIDPVRAQIVAQLCRLIRDTNPRVPYSFRLGLNVRFCAQTGDLLTLGDGHGLNCSNFVITVFQSTGITLVDLDGWELREDDEERHRCFFDMMLNDVRIPTSHLFGVWDEIGCKRVRPEETAGACLEDELPAKYEQCKLNGEAVLRLIDDHPQRLIRLPALFSRKNERA